MPWRASWAKSFPDSDCTLQSGTAIPVHSVPSRPDGLLGQHPNRFIAFGTASADSGGFVPPNENQRSTLEET